jgi:hypothetical protein
MRPVFGEYYRQKRWVTVAVEIIEKSRLGKTFNKGK